GRDAVRLSLRRGTGGRSRGTHGGCGRCRLLMGGPGSRIYSEISGNRSLRGSGGDCVPDRAAIHDQFHTPIELPSGGAVIGGHRLSLSETLGCDVPGGHPLGDKEFSYRVSPLLGKLLVVFVTSHIIGVTFHLNVEPRVGKQDARDLRQPLPGFTFER